MALLEQKRLLLIKPETTYGTSANPGASDALLCRSIEITPIQADTVNRDLIKNYLGNSEQYLTNERAEITFEVELAGSGTVGTAPRWGAAMRAAGFSQVISANTSVTYAPVSSGNESVTIDFHNDGIRHRITGARGTVSMNLEVSAVPTLSFTMTGLYSNPTDITLPTPSYGDQAQPLPTSFTNTTNFSALGFAGQMQSFSYEHSNEIVYRELVGQSTGEVLVTNRGPQGSCVIEHPTIAQQNFYTAARSNSSSKGDITFQQGSSAGNIATFTVKADIAQPAVSYDNGISMLTLPYIAVATNAGNNEASLVLT